MLTDYDSGHDLGQMDVTLLKLLFVASTIINIIWHSHYEGTRIEFGNLFNATLL